MIQGLGLKQILHATISISCLMNNSMNPVIDDHDHFHQLRHDLRSDEPI